MPSGTRSAERQNRTVRARPQALGIITGNQKCQGVRSILQDRRPRNEWKGDPDRFSVERPLGKEIEIRRRSVTQSQCDGSPAVEDEPETGGGRQFGPQAILRGGQRIEARCKCAPHPVLHARGLTASRRGEFAPREIPAALTPACAPAMPGPDPRRRFRAGNASTPRSAR